MLYLNVPIVFGLLYVILSNIQSQHYETYELVGLVLSSGILLATNGINVAQNWSRHPYFGVFKQVPDSRVCICTFT